MGYLIRCSSESCRKETRARNIIDLIYEHTEKNGKIKCTVCGSTNAFIFQESKLQEKGECWKRYVKAVIPIETGCETFTPYVFLTADTENGEINGIHFDYYKDTRKEGGKLKHGSGPGGAPVLSKNELFQLLEKLIDFGCFSIKDILDFINKKK